MRDLRTTGERADRGATDDAEPGPGKRSLIESSQLQAIPGGAAGDPGVLAAMPRAGGALLPHAQRMTAAFGTSFDDVAVRTGARSEMQGLGAQAVTRGNEITFASDQPSEHLVAHELTHVVQQRRGGATAQAKPIEPGARDALEQEADAVADRVAAGGPAGAIHGVAHGTGLRKGGGPGQDVLPQPVAMTVLGDPFQISFRRGADHQLYCDVHYTGPLAAEAPSMGDDHVLRLGAQLDDPTRKLAATLVSSAPGAVTLDLYGDGVVLAKLTDTTSPGEGIRRHGLTWAVGRNGLGEAVALTIKAPRSAAAGGAKGGGGTVSFTAIDAFTLDAARYGDAHAVAVTLRGTGVPNPQTFVVPVDGDLGKVTPRVLDNDGHAIKIDLNGDGKTDVTLIHSVEQVDRGVHSHRIHHFRQLDRDGVVIGPSEGLQYANFGPPVAIPAAQDERATAALANREAPANRPPQQGDVIGEVPRALASPGGVIEMRVDGDGDRTKELLLRFKALPAAEGAAKGQIRVDLIQLSSIGATGATGAAQSQSFDAPAGAVKALGPWVTQIANGHDPLEIELVALEQTPSGATLKMQLFPPISHAAHHRSYAVSIDKQTRQYEFPAEARPDNPLVKSASSGNTGGISRFEVVLGEFGDRFWVMFEPQPGGPGVFSIAALNPDGPAGARGFPVTGRATTFARVASGANSLAIDLDNDGKPDLQLFDALSAPLYGGSSHAPLRAERDHAIKIVGAAIGGDQQATFLVRDGRFVDEFWDNAGAKGRDQQAAAAASATQILGDQASESRTKDASGNARDGDVGALMSRIAGMLTANRLKAKNAGAISDRLYTAWEQLSTQLIVLGPQLAPGADKAGRDAKLQDAAAASAEAFYREFSAATAAAVHKTYGRYQSQSVNDFTGTHESAGLVHTVEGPGVRLPDEIRAGRWSQVTADFDQLVAGLDRWIAAKLPAGHDAQAQQYLTGMQASLGKVKDKPGVVRISAAFQPDASYNTNTRRWSEIPLMLLAWQADGKWWLQDSTNPGREPFLDRVDAHPGDTHPPAEIFQQLDYARHFPKGIIHYQIPGGLGGQVITTERKSWTDFVQWIGLGLAVVGISLATFGTGTVAATAAAVAFAASGVAGAVYAGGDLYERAQHGDLEPAAVVMDLAQIAAGLLGAGAAISGSIAVSAANADRAVTAGVEGAVAWSGAAARIAGFAQKAYVPLLGGAAAADGVNLMAMTADIAAQIAKIREGAGSPADKRAAIIALLAQGIALTGITILSIKGAMPEIRSGRAAIVVELENGIPVARATRAEPAPLTPKPVTSPKVTSSGAVDHAPSPADDWVTHVRTRLDAEAQARLDTQRKTQSSQQLMDHFQGDIDAAVDALTKPGIKPPPPAKDTVEELCLGALPARGPARWKYIENPANWPPARAALHDALLAKARMQAQAFADAMQKGQPTVYAMRGNTAAGKTRAVNTVPELAGAMTATERMPYRAINPDSFKPDLIAATPGKTSSQVHSEASMLATRLQEELEGLKTSDGKELGSILIDRRLAELKDVQDCIKLAKDTGRKFNLYDIDAPLEVSLAGVLERQAGGADPLPPFDAVAGGFSAVRNNRKAIVEMFSSDATLGTYELYATTARGDRVKVATVQGGHPPALLDEALYLQLIAEGGARAELLAQTRITSQAVEDLIKDLPAERQAKIRGVLQKYEGWTWKSALDAHSLEQAKPSAPTTSSMGAARDGR